MRVSVARTALAVALVPIALVTAPAAAHACSYVNGSVAVVAPADNASFVQTAGSVPVQARFDWARDSIAPMQFGIARLHASLPAQLGTFLPAEVGTVVETGQLTYDPATGLWTGAANANGWAQTPGEYVWQVTATQNIPATPPREPDANGYVLVTSCDTPVPFTINHDGRWVHRITVLGASAVTARAAKARDGRAKVSGTVARTFPGKVRLTVACAGKRERTTFVATHKGRWNRTVLAKRGCQVKAAVAARPGWAASSASSRIG